MTSSRRNQPWDTITIVGVGLIGGSIGLRLLRSRQARCVIGVGRDEPSLALARKRGAVTEIGTLEEAVPRSQAVIVCTPVGSIAGIATRALSIGPPHTWVTDTGSTKATVVQAVDDALGRTHRFVGSHPFAGDDATGVRFARPDLFDDRVVAVTPTVQSDTDAIHEVLQFWKLLGAATTILTAPEHDALAAESSHLPHLIAATLAAILPPAAAPLVGSGWRDTTRVARGNVEMWCDILTSNRANLVAALARFDEQLDAWREALSTGDRDGLEKLLMQGKAKRDAVGG